MPALGVAMRTSVALPSVVIRPMRLEVDGVNQSAPSGPVVMPMLFIVGVRIGNSVIVPSGVMRPTLFVSVSVNHTLPSGPAVIPCGCCPAWGPETP